MSFWRDAIFSDEGPKYTRVEIFRQQPANPRNERILPLLTKQNQ
jgi:hypothetical protein